MFSKLNPMKGFLRDKKAILLLAFLLSWAGIFIAISTFGWNATWLSFGIESMSPPFGDLRTVQGGLISLSQGLDPQVANPGDPWGRPMNYPAIWLEIAKVLHFENESAYLFSVGVVVVLYCAICFYLLSQYPSVWLLLISLSGASLLAVERGNNDLVIFILLFLAASSPLLVRGALILVATLLKIYPIFSVLSMAIHKKYSVALMAAVSTFLVGSYILWTHAAELQKLKTATPVGALQSYGSLPLSLSLDKFGGATTPMVVSGILIILSLILWYFMRAKSCISPTGFEQKAQTLFLVGAPIFSASFVLMGNWDYRLIFLIFCVPYLLAIKSNALRNCVLTLTVLASNQAMLFLLFNRVGITVCKVSKALLFIVITAILIQMLLQQLDKNSRQQIET
jgi:hypothetical protein